MNEEETEKAPIREISFHDTKEEIQTDGTSQTVFMYIPRCCREGWDSCRHVIGPQRKQKRNIAV